MFDLPMYFDNLDDAELVQLVAHVLSEEAQ